ncbi:hypothetical protein, partial [Pseudovibrio flavus]|uniref:hypothetical protein n=1 Tax=Pseudovibrio flavus TaxID=2529854 RepID=UPI00211C3A7E
MGRGSYIGGSTIIYPGSDWFSYPGRSTTIKPSKPRKGQKSAPSGTNISHNKTLEIDVERNRYLHTVIDSELRGEKTPNISKRSSLAFTKQVSRYADGLQWARSQPEYIDLKTKKEKKREKRLRKQETGKVQNAAH